MTYKRKKRNSCLLEKFQEYLNNKIIEAENDENKFLDKFLLKFCANNWLYIAWIIEIILIFIYSIILYHFFSYIANELLDGKISSILFYRKHRGWFAAIIDGTDLLALQFIEWIKTLFT